MTETAVIKIGAGISGLTLAQHLHQQHNPFRIFERDEGISSRSGGWGLTLHWALPALRELLPEHILSRLPETFVDREAPAQGSPGKYQFFDLRSGTALFRVPAVERIRVSRTRLRASLVSGIDI